MIIVNIETYGDFDMLSTVVSMVAPQMMSKKIARELKKEAEELFKNTADVDSVIKYLRGWGFETCNTISIAIGGNL